MLDRLMSIPIFHREGHRFDSDILHFFNLECEVMIEDVADGQRKWFDSITLTTTSSL
jgi:hypothetical protein